jgi:hypothetical protein
VLRQARVVFHLGAHFAWGLSLEHSRAVNVEGAKRVALLAAEQKSRLVMIGGYMLKIMNICCASELILVIRS